MKSTTKRLRDLFPKTKRYRSGYLKVSKLHTIHFEECGNPRGKPLVFLHGGPGGGIDPVYRRYFDPKKWRIVLHRPARLRQEHAASRSCARTRPGISWPTSRSCASTSASTAGSCSAGAGAARSSLAYAETHPERCKALVLRGIFLLRRERAPLVLPGGREPALPRRVGALPRADSVARARRHDEGLLQAPHQSRPPRAPAGRARLVDLGGQHEQALLRPGAREEVRRRQVRRRLRAHRGALLRERGVPEAATTSSCATSGRFARSRA